MKIDNLTTISQLLSHYDGSYEQTLVLLNILKNESETTQILILHLILSLCELSLVTPEKITKCFPTSPYVMSVRLVRVSDGRGVLGNYKVLACMRNAEGAEVEPVELHFPTRAGKVLYILTLALSSPAFGKGQGLSRYDIRKDKEEQYATITRLFRLLYDDKVKSEDIHSFFVNTSRFPEDKNFFSRSKCDTNAVINQCLHYIPNPFVIEGKRNQNRTIKATLDVDDSDPEMIECLRHFVEITTARPFWCKDE